MVVVLQVYLTVLPERAAQETGNLSLVWCCLVLMFAYRILLSLTGLYFEVLRTQTSFHNGRYLVIVNDSLVL